MVRHNVEGAEEVHKDDDCEVVKAHGMTAINTTQKVVIE